ncbi:MAG: WYL domain-containing protein [Oscillospiraceae bacterium]|jgi:predicted DNA-binding transcriptional regulator YafY|nr:WYL domain-containing protein [Oscillospiraceae bacterium]
MAGNPNQKLKLLYLAQFLQNNTDEEHCASIKDISEMLASHGVTSERKSLYKDIEALNTVGFEIVKGYTPSRGYCIGKRQFELAELRLLIDAVESSPIIPPERTSELTRKLKSLTSVHLSEQLGGVLYTENQVKSTNEEILNNIDCIHRAIRLKKKIKFTYSHMVLKDNIPSFSEGREFVISPYAAIWNSDKYYLVGNYEKYNDLSHYRIDRMRAAECTAQDIRHYSEVSEYSDVFDCADYSRKIFNMYSGSESVPIELLCDNSVLEAIIDKFGVFAKFEELPEEGKFAVLGEGIINSGLVRWIINFGGAVFAKSPPKLVQEVQKMLYSMRDSYKK